MKCSLKILLPCFLFLLVECRPLPKNKIFSFYYTATYSMDNDSIRFELKNTLKCPLSINAFSDNKVVQEMLNGSFPVILEAENDTMLSSYIHLKNVDVKIQFSGNRGNPYHKTSLKAISLPFQRGKSYQINQGYNGSFSHQNPNSKYALDFNLQVGDTICAAADGYVVGVIEKYQYGGESIKWSDYANEVTIYHPDMNVFSQYAHLKFEGSLVTLGDTVYSGDPIAIAGMTGYTRGPHLHFCVFNVIENNHFNLLKTEFIEGYHGDQLLKGMFVKK